LHRGRGTRDDALGPAPEPRDEAPARGAVGPLRRDRSHRAQRSRPAGGGDAPRDRTRASPDGVAQLVAARYDAVLLDAYGTLVELDDPFERLRESVRRHIGADVEIEDAERAFRAEMAHYAGNCHTGAGAASLAALRSDCAAIILAE